MPRHTLFITKLPGKFGTFFRSFYFLFVIIQLVNFLFRGIEDVISFLIKAAVAVAKGGVESLVESMVSVVEAQNLSSRGISNQESLEDEVMVAWNGKDCHSLVCKLV